MYINEVVAVFFSNSWNKPSTCELLYDVLLFLNVHKVIQDFPDLCSGTLESSSSKAWTCIPYKLRVGFMLTSF